MKQNCAILILSCDKYSDLWTPFFDLFWKNWPECPYPVYLGSNFHTFHHKKVKNILTGKDFDWSTSFKKILQLIPEKYIYVLLEDVFITNEIYGSYFEECFRFFATKNLNHLRFNSLPNSRSVPKKPKFSLVQKHEPYRVHVMGFWKKDYLRTLLLEGESPWNFEIMGSYRTAYDDGFYSLASPLYSSIHVVKKDKWIPNSLQYCLDNKIDITISRRKKLPPVEIFLYNLKEYYFTFVYFHIDWKIRVRLMNLLRKALLSY